MKKVISAGGVVLRKNNNQVEIALIKDPYGRFALPKGHLEKEETNEEAAIREVKEEMGCEKVKIIKYLDKIEYFFKDPYGRDGKKGELIKKEVYYYLMEVAPDEKCIPQKDEGIEEIVWVSTEEAIKISDYKNNLPLFKKVIKEIKNIS